MGGSYPSGRSLMNEGDDEIIEDFQEPSTSKEVDVFRQSSSPESSSSEYVPTPKKKCSLVPLDVKLRMTQQHGQRLELLQRPPLTSSSKSNLLRNGCHVGGYHPTLTNPLSSYFQIPTITSPEQGETPQTSNCRTKE
ncbi:hypothetical protein J437_LFUL008028 [Ladona fulva]|uniref:Uncharacterized protein n=1 Tax=Ladona fulva TaxID=123851 RepID=A0A8K0P6B3_LADFU|nr:hypothetical protein J437_LFUL008028 [Ladona fulva]